MPRDNVELKLTKIWENVLNIQSIGVRDNFFNIGGDSLLALRIFAQIEKIFNRELPLPTLIQAPTIEQLARIIRQEEWSAHWSPLVSIQPGGSKWPFFCIHGCGGSATNYYDLARYLGLEQPFFALQALGIDRNQAPQKRIEDMATLYIKEIRSIQPEGPYFLGGGGGGGTIAFEIAQQLKAQGQKTDLLVLIDPGSPRVNSSSMNPSIYRKSLTHYVRRLVFHLQRRQLSQIIKDKLLYGVCKRWKILHILIPRHIRRIQRVKDTQIRALLSYEPQFYTGRITCILPEVSSDNSQGLIEEWRQLAACGLDVHFVNSDCDPVGHGGIFNEPFVRGLAEKLKDSLEAFR
jgi:thioesterase domain-containing protein/acyl carrier protein